MQVRVSSEISKLVADSVAEIIAARVASRIFAKDSSIWGPEAQSEAEVRLGWVASAFESTPLVAEIIQLRRELNAAGINRIALCGMGGSSLAPEVITKTDSVELIVVDSTSPDQVASALIDLERTVAVVSSKSGSTLETDSLKRAFEAAFEAAGIDPLQRIIIVTDPGSPLDVVSREAGYKVFNADPNVGGRYSALTAFGLVPSGLAGADIAGLLSSAQNASASLASDSSDNPAIWLAAALAATPGLNGNRDKFLIETDSMAGFGDWVEQLVAESTGKEQRGTLPVVVSGAAPELGLNLPDTLTVRFSKLEAEGSGAVTFSGDLGELFMLWEQATAIMGWLLKSNPFDQPNVESAKIAARALLDSPTVAKAVDFVDGGVSVSTRGFNLAGTTLDSAVDQLLLQLKDDGYFSIHAYISRVEFPQFTELRDAVATKTSRPTTFGWGPRFLHSTGQYHKGGPLQGVFLQILISSDFDLDIPNRPFSFGTLLRAQAEGDANVLAANGSAVMTIELSNPFADLERLKRVIAS